MKDRNPRQKENIMFDEIFELAETTECSLCCSSSGGGNADKVADA